MTLILIIISLMVAIDIALNIATRMLFKSVKRTLEEAKSVHAEIDQLVAKIRASA